MYAYLYLYLSLYIYMYIYIYIYIERERERYYLCMQTLEQLVARTPNNSDLGEWVQCKLMSRSGLMTCSV